MVSFVWLVSAVNRDFTPLMVIAYQRNTSISTHLLFFLPNILHFLLFDFIIYLKNIGLEGIEVFNADKTKKEQLLYYLQIAKKLNLLTTSGSDFHREEETKILGVNNEYSNNFIKLVKERRK